MIAFYYVWKKHRNGMTWQRGERKNSESDESRLESDVELTGETLQLATKLHRTGYKPIDARRMANYFIS